MEMFWKVGNVWAFQRRRGRDCHKEQRLPNRRHPERKSRDPEEVTFKLVQRDPSTALGMTVALCVPGKLNNRGRTASDDIDTEAEG
jgi:hypothetical protein